MGLPLTCLLVMQKICISRTGLVYVPVIALSDRNLARPYTLYQSRELRCVIFSRQYFWFKRKSVTFLKRSCRHVFFALAPRSRASRATFTRSQSYSTSLFFHANSHDLRRLIYVDKTNNMYITYIQKKKHKMFVLFDLHWNMYYHRMWYKKKCWKCWPWAMIVWHQRNLYIWCKWSLYSHL